MNYTNLKRETYKHIDELYEEIETLQKIIGGYCYRYKIFDEEDKQEITTNILIELNKHIIKELNSGYIHRIIKNVILLHLRPVVKQIKLETTDEFNPISYDNSVSEDEQYFNLLNKIIEICPETHKEYIEFELSTKTKTDISISDYNRLTRYKRDIRAVASMYHNLFKLANNEDLIPIYAKKHNVFRSVLKEFVNLYKKNMIKC